MSQWNSQDSISTFYAGKCIFVTGCSGFMGKVLIEKLLRSCPDIEKIYVLMRPKKNMNIKERIENLLNLPLFSRLRGTPERFEKIIPVSGDASTVGLGLTAEDRQLLIENVSIIFHVAASVRFDDPLKDAILLNTRSARDICLLAMEMKKLVAFMHVSTTYCQADKPTVAEKLYPCLMDWKQVVTIAENIDDHTLNILTPTLKADFPNTYTFSKRLAEGVIADYEGLLPIILYRPSIVISSWKEPYTGWIDNFNGPVGLMVGGAKGVLRAVHINPNTRSDFIPVDIAIKGMIVSSWKRGIVPIMQDPSIQVYNCAAENTKLITWGQIIHMALLAYKDTPFESSFWHPSVTFATTYIHYYIIMLIFHLIPAMIVDAILKLIGKKTILVKLQRKIYIANVALKHYIYNQWQFVNENFLALLSTIPSVDIEDFSFDYATFEINDYMRKCIVGAKVFLFKEDMKNVEECKKQYNRMYWLDRFLKVLLLFFFARWFYGIYYTWKMDDPGSTIVKLST